MKNENRADRFSLLMFPLEHGMQHFGKPGVEHILYERHDIRLTQRLDLDRPMALLRSAVGLPDRRDPPRLGLLTCHPESGPGDLTSGCAFYRTRRGVASILPPE